MLKYFQKNEIIVVFTILIVIFCQMFFNEYFNVLDEFEKDRNNIVYQLQFQKHQDDYLVRYLKNYSLEYLEKIEPKAKNLDDLLIINDEKKYIAKDQNMLNGEIYGKQLDVGIDDIFLELEFAISLDKRFKRILLNNQHINNIYYISKSNFIYKWPKSTKLTIEEHFSNNVSEEDIGIFSSEDTLNIETDIFDKNDNYYGTIIYGYSIEQAYSFLEDGYNTIIVDKKRNELYTNIKGKNLDLKVYEELKKTLSLSSDVNINGEILMTNGFFYYLYVFSDGSVIVQSIELKDVLLRAFKATSLIMFISIIYIIFLVFKSRYEKSTEKLNEAMLELDENYDKLKVMANTDFLTDMYNRGGFTNAVNELFKSNKTIIFIITDIDKFKKVNDNYGHETGDLVLKEFSKTMKTVLSSKDIIGRWGGEEFVMAFTDISEAQANKIAEELRIKVLQLEIDAGEYGIVKISSSFGIAKHYSENGSFLNTISQADEALYYSKRNGRNRVTKYSDLESKRKQS